MKKQFCLLAGLILAGAMSAAVSADDIFEDWSVGEIDEIVGDAYQGYEVYNSDGDPEIPEADRKDPADDSAALIVDEGTFSAAAGAQIDEVMQIEAEAEEAAAKVQDLMNNGELLLPPAQGDTLSAYLQKLLEIPSPTGSDGELLTGRYIEETLKEMGYDVSEQTFHEGFLNEDYVDVPGINIIAERGADAEMRTDDIIIICGHYDSKTLTGEASGEGETPQEAAGGSSAAADSAGAGQADQSAAGQASSAADLLENEKTGAAVMMETARILSEVESCVDLCFVFFSGEEDGYYGSRSFVENLSEELRGRVRAVIYIGSVGYMKKDKTALPFLLDTGTGKGNEPGNLLRATALMQQAEKMQEWLEAGYEFEEEALQEDVQILDSTGTKEAVSAGTKGSSQESAPADAAVQFPKNSWTYVEDREKGMPELTQSFTQAEIPCLIVYQDVQEHLKADPQVWLQAGALVEMADVVAKTVSAYMYRPFL